MMEIDLSGKGPKERRRNQQIEEYVRRPQVKKAPSQSLQTVLRNFRTEDPARFRPAALQKIGHHLRRPPSEMKGVVNAASRHRRYETGRIPDQQDAMTGKGTNRPPGRDEPGPPFERGPVRDRQ